MKITQELCIIDDCGRRVARSQSTNNEAIKNVQSRETDNIGYTRHMTKVRENQRGNQECTVQRHWQHWVHKTHDRLLVVIKR